MKEIPRTYVAGFRRLILRRRDINQLLTMITSVGAELTLSDDTHTYDSLDDLKTNRGPTVHRLKIEFERPNGSLDLGKDREWFVRFSNILSVSAATKEGELLFIKLRDYLRPRQTFSSRIFSFPGLGWLIVFFFVTMSIIPFHAQVFHIDTAIIFGSLIALVVGFMVSFIIHWVKGVLTIDLEPAESRTTFLSRKKDDIAILAIGAVLGAVLSQVAQWVFAFLRHSK